MSSVKPYVKPDIVFEDFRLTQSVAACRWDMVHDDEFSCVAEYDIFLTATGDEPSGSGMLLFHDQRIGCRINEAQAQDYCYTNAAPNMTVWAS